MTDLVQVNSFWFGLALASDAEQLIAAKAGGGSGQGDLVEALSQLPMALEERGRPKGFDHVFLSRYDGTDLVQWLGRNAKGWLRPIGRLMRIEQIAPDKQD